MQTTIPRMDKQGFTVYSTGTHILYLMVNHNGEEYEKEYIHTHTYTCITEPLCYAAEIDTTS